MAQLPDKPLARLKGHNGPIHALTYSSGAGQYILSGSSDKTINLYSAAKATSAVAASSSIESGSGALIQSYTGVHGYDVLSIAVADDNSRFVSGGGDKTVFLWDVSTAQTIRRYGGGAGSHGARVECVAFGGEGDCVVVSGSYDSTVRLWDTKSQSNRPLLVLSEARDSVSSVVVVEHEITTGSVDGRIRTYDLRMGMAHVDVIGQPVTSLATTRQADSILASSLDSTLRLMDKANGKVLQSYKYSDFVNSTYRIRSTLGENDSMALSGSENGSICCWDILSGRLLTRLQHTPESASDAKPSKRVVSALAYKAKGGEWASAGGDGTIVVWGRRQ